MCLVALLLSRRRGVGRKRWVILWTRTVRLGYLRRTNELADQSQEGGQVKGFSEKPPVRIRRIERGFSQEELAEVVGLHVTHVSSLERGLANLTFQSLERLAVALNTPLSALIAEAELRLKLESERRTGEKRRRPRGSPEPLS